MPDQTPKGLAPSAENPQITTRRASLTSRGKVKLPEFHSSHTTQLRIEASTLESLPTELMCVILSHLSPQDLLRALCTSRWWSELAQEALYSTVNVRSLEIMEMLVAHDEKRGTKRPTGNLSLDIWSCGLSTRLAIVNCSMGLERFRLEIWDTPQEVGVILQSSGLAGMSEEGSWCRIL